MDVRRVRAAGASLVTVALMGLAASPALAAPGVSVSAVSSLKAGATAGTLTGKVVNDTNKATRSEVSVRIMRRGTHHGVIGRTTVKVAAHGSTDYSVAVKLPSGLTKGNYYLSACTPRGSGAGAYGCATAQDDVLIKGGTPVRGTQVAVGAGHGLAGPGLQRRRAHAGQAGLPAVPGDGQHGLQQPAHRHQPDLRRADEPLPAGHARRPPAARDAVPDRVQPRLRAHERVHRRQRHRHGPEPVRAVDHDQRPAGDLHVQAADVPGRSERPGRS